MPKPVSLRSRTRPLVQTLQSAAGRWLRPRLVPSQAGMWATRGSRDLIAGRDAVDNGFDGSAVQAEVLQGLRVRVILHSNESGGVEALAATLAREFGLRGAKVETVFLYPAFTASPLLKTRGILRGAFAILRDPPDVLIAYQSTASVLVGLLGRLAGVGARIVHQTAVPRHVHPLVRWLDRVIGARSFYTTNIVNSLATEREFHAYPIDYRSRLRRIEHGLRLPEPTMGREATLARLGVPASARILLSAGRLSDQKAQDVAIHALPLLHGTHLVLAGGGPKHDRYARLASKLGVADRVHLIGAMERYRIADLLAATDCFVFPSRWETFGLAPVEAVMAGVPVVARDLAVLREVLSVEGVTSVQFVRGDAPEIWAAAVEAGLSAGRCPENALGARLAVRYCEQRMVDGYVDLLTRRGA